MKDAGIRICWISIYLCLHGNMLKKWGWHGVSGGENWMKACEYMQTGKYTY